MKPAKFKYWAPGAVDEVVDFLAEHGDDAKLLAGGQSLMPVMNMRLARPQYLVDLGRVDGLREIRESNGDLAIGAMATQEAVLGSALAGQACPLLHAAIPWVGHLAIRHRGTVGGSIVHADPSAELPAVAIALDAQMVLRGDAGIRSVPAEEFFISYFTTAAEPGELLTDVRFPKQRPDTRVAVQEIARRHGDFALAGVVLCVNLAAEGTVASVRICAFGVHEVPRRLTAAENLLAGELPSEELMREVGQLASQAVEPEGDMHASAEYRREMTGVLTRRAMHSALSQPGAHAQ
jgi:carbon-monoxide dehydrogenase medium subunit